jgi:hypothetical protein
MNNNGQDKTDRHILWAIVSIVLAVVLAYAYEDYINFVLQQEKIKVIKQAIEAKMDSDQVKGLLNSKNN